MTLMCGLTIEKINEKGGINPNKFLSYLALSNSATDPWNDFDIDKSIVVEDFETNVQGEVDYIDSKTYKIIRQEKEVKIPHTDGCGIMLNGPTRMIRAPFIKGLLITFPFDKFIKEKCKNGTCIIKDIYGKEYDILADGIEYIFTKSQFKLYKYYSSWQEYKDNFKKYNCEVCYCNIEENYIPKSRINYQMLQTLTDITSNEINYLIKNTIKEINGIQYRFDKKGYRVNDRTNEVKRSKYYLSCDRVNGLMTVYADKSRTIPIKTIRVSVGNPTTLTPAGTFTVKRSLRWQPLMGPSWGQYGSHVVGGIYVHSVACGEKNDHNLPVGEYLRLGNPASHGCIRCCVADAKWVFDNCNGSEIKIYDGIYKSDEALKGPLGRKALTPLRGAKNFDPTDPAYN